MPSNIDDDVESLAVYLEAEETLPTAGYRTNAKPEVRPRVAHARVNIFAVWAWCMAFFAIGFVLARMFW